MSSWWEAGTTPLRGIRCASIAVALFGCNTFDEPVDESNGSRLVIPTDVRTPHFAEHKPPPVSGGTLLVTKSGALAVASDPERDAIVVADLGTGSLVGSIALETGDEPGRLVEDDAGRVHVALRRSGAVITVNPATLTVLDRRPVCGAPRGIALSAPDTLAIACAEGKLVTLPTGAGGVLRTIALEPDVRDVIVSGGAISVTRFKAAEVLHLDAAGAIIRRERPTSVYGTRMVPIEGADQSDPSLDVPRQQVVQPFRPLVAWRTLAGPGGSTIMVHQRAVDAPIEIAPKPTMMGSSYGGGGFSCSGINQNAVTVIGPSGGSANVTFAGPPLPVDAALSADGTTLAIVHAGPADPTAPRPFMVFDDFGSEGDVAPSGSAFGSTTGTLSLVTVPSAPTTPASPEGTIAPDPTCISASSFGIVDPAVAVAFNPSRQAQLVIQTRQPSSFVVFDDFRQATPRTIPFGDGSTLDTGFQLFHRDSGGGIACASCHAEGAEDGNVWRFADVGDRRTQALNIGLRGTAPFHWDGKLQSVGALMNEVFVGRMGGIHESPARLRGLEDWIFAMTPAAPMRQADEAAVQRGKLLFESASTGCTSCHWGRHFTNNDTRDVGTSSTEIFQVPSLVGIGYRAPFMHDGCAATLAGRFDPACGGGEKHGHTADLSPEQIADLVAYLESL